MQKCWLGLMFKVARLRFLLAGLLLFILGGLLAVLSGARFDLLRFVFGYLVIMPAHLSVHFSNDYFDAGSDTRGGSTMVSGGAGVLLDHPELLKPVKWTSIGLICLSFIMGLAFMPAYHYPAWMFAYVLLGNFLGWFYSAPPLRFVAYGLGEPIFTFIIGFMLPAMGYLVLKGRLDSGGVFFVLPLLLYAMVFIFNAEIPDMEDDYKAEKRTWVSGIGRGAGFVISGGLLVLATLYFFLHEFISVRSGVIDMTRVGMFSLLPLVPGLIGSLKRPRNRRTATTVSTAVIFGLVGFCLLMDGYLAWLVFE